MSTVNARARDHRKEHGVTVAGGFGATAARQEPEQLLRRAVLANLLREDLAYQSGATVVAEITRLVGLVPAERVAALAIEARVAQRLRHVPLVLARECARLESHRHVVADLLPQIVLRPDELTEFMALYWKDGRVPLAAGVKEGLARAFQRFSAYQLAKYDRSTAVRLRDVLFLVHAKPKDDEQAGTWRSLVAGDLPVPDTWEVALSAGKDKRETWERLINEKRLGALAFLRNLRNMEQAAVAREVVRRGFAELNTEMLLPLNFFAAARTVPKWQPEIEEAMLRSLAEVPKLLGETILVIDVSGSMWAPISAHSTFSRLDAAAAMAIIAREMCEHIQIWATAGSDAAHTHKTVELPLHRGFALAEKIEGARSSLGGGGIFTRQCLEHVKAALGDAATDRTIVFSDSQDCDYADSGAPHPFSTHNYIVDVSAHTRGVAYEGVWTAEVSGWSERFLAYIAALEGEAIQVEPTPSQ